MVGCPLCAAAIQSCEVVADRWVQPHLAVRSWFPTERWTIHVTQPAQVTLLWPACWLPKVDKSRESNPAEVHRAWETDDDRLEVVNAQDVLNMNAASDCGDVSDAWVTWSVAPESALVDAYL